MTKSKFIWSQIDPETLTNEEFLAYVNNAIPHRYDDARDLLEGVQGWSRGHAIYTITKTVSS